jgi:flagellar motility protein MotE (MotC chaperone)
MQIVLWALLTGGITGAVWVGIVMYQRQRRIDHGRRDLDEMDTRLDELEGAERRVAELEERLDFAERLLTQKRQERLDQK